MNSYKTSAIVNDRWNDLGFCLARVLRLAVIATLHGALMFPLLSVLLGAAAQPALAQTESVLYSFTGGTDGAYPYGTLVRDAKTGNLYGTAAFGGNPSCVHKPPGCGVVFEVFPTGIEKVLYSFNGGTDGEWPFDGLLRVGGNFYGTAFAGGAYGQGVVFNVTSSGKEKVIYSFVGPPDGSGPTGNLVRDALGNLYGTTLGGGNSSRYGTVFELSATGTEKLLYVFRGGSDGSYPYAGLLRDAKTGNLYGTTNSGGAHGAGTVFEVTPAGVETILYAFAGNPDGARPIGGLIRDAKGNFYGTTQVGGNFHGTVFELTRAGTEKVLYAFTTGGVDGEYPQGGLVLDTKTGNLYGTTLSGGVYGHGTVFEVTPAGVETVLYSFTGGVDGGGPGGYPQGSLVRDAATGSLYGTTEVGGTYGYGTVFKVTP